MIKDVAQAFGAQASSLGLAGDIGTYSFSVGTGLTLYEGGLLLARDARVRDALDDAERSLRRHAPLLELRRCAELLGMLSGHAALYRLAAPAGNDAGAGRAARGTGLSRRRPARVAATRALPCHEPVLYTTFLRVRKIMLCARSAAQWQSIARNPAFLLPLRCPNKSIIYCPADATASC